MARQLIFTSAPRGLAPGRTGLVTVARHRELDEALVAELERWSRYDRAPFGGGRLPEVFVLRGWERGGTRAYVLTRTVDAGVDYSGRANFLAHHLIVEPREIQRAPMPALLALGWKGWLNRWTGGPRWLDERDELDFDALSLDPPPAPGGPVEEWVENGQPRSGEATYPLGAERAWVAAVAEASRKVDVQAWELTWTTVPQTQDGTIFVWRGVPGGVWRFQPDPPEPGIRVRSEAVAKPKVSGRDQAVVRVRTTSSEDSSAVSEAKAERGTSGDQRESWDQNGPVWSWPALAVGLVLIGLVLWIVVASLSPGQGKRWAEETRELMRTGQVAAVESRLRMLDQGGNVGPEGMSVAREARLWVAAERKREQLRHFREARDSDGLVRALQGMESDPDWLEWRRISASLVREREEAMAWLSARKEAERLAEAAVENVEEAGGQADETALAEARLRVESLGGPAGNRLRGRLARASRAKDDVVLERDQGAVVSPVEREATPTSVLRAISPASQDGSALWGGSQLTRIMGERLWETKSERIEVGRLDSRGIAGQGIALQAVRTAESVKFYREMDLMLEVRRAGPEGLGWIPAKELMSGDRTGWWFGIEGAEVRFFCPMPDGSRAPVQAPLTDLTVDVREGRKQIKINVMRTMETLALVEGLMARLEIEVQRQKSVTTARSGAIRMGHPGWEEKLAVEVLAEDVLLEGRLILEEKANGMENVWRLVEFRREPL